VAAAAEANAEKVNTGVINDLGRDEDKRLSDP